jgi:hypothetical protein
MIDDPKVAVIGSIVGSIPASIALVLAQTTWPDVGLELVKTFGTVAGAAIALIGTIYAIKANTKAGEAKAEASAAKSASVAAATTVTEAATALNTKADTAADAAAKAARLAHTAAQVTVSLDKKADKRGELLVEVAKSQVQVASHTNGEYARLMAERDELQKRVELLLLEKTPPTVASTIAHVAETVDAVADKVGAPKSGTKLKAVPPAEPVQ